MEFLKELALPQSSNHVQLLLFILNLVYVVFLPYLGLLLSASVIARVYERKGHREGKPNYGRFAEDLIALPLNRKSLPLFLGLIPALSKPFQAEALEILIAWGEKRTEAIELIELASQRHPDVNSAEELVPLVYRLKQGVEV